MNSLSIFSLIAFGIFFGPTLIFASYCPFPAAKNNTQVSAVINVAGTMDFQNARLTATSALRSSCSIDGSVNGQHIINIKDGGTVKNVILADPAKGIWCEGTCTLQNVYFEKVCYHAAGFASPGNGASTETHQVIGGAAQNVPDKIFTQSSKGKTIITNFCAENFSRVYRSCGSGCVQYTRSVQITNSKFKGKADSIIALNKNRGDSMSISGITLDSSSTIKAICQEYNEPSTSTVNVFKLNQDGTGTSCKYSKSAIKINS